MEKSKLVNMPLAKLEHHPDNPRKDLGDLTELTESIRANGLLQNMTVVPGESGMYLVIIGNRRFEAAKAAGLKKALCRVVEGLSQAEQVAIMLEDNLQRADLSVPEQAWGFQQLIDLGESVGDIQEKTGFSETTIRQRLKIAELDKDVLEKAYGKHQITIGEFTLLEKVEDIEERNKILENNPDSIAWAVNSYESKKKREEWLAETVQAVANVRPLKEIPENTDTFADAWEQVLAVRTGEEPEVSELPDGEIYWVYQYGELEFFTYNEEKHKQQEAEKEKNAKENEEAIARSKRVAGILDILYQNLKQYVYYLRDAEDNDLGVSQKIDSEVRIESLRRMWDIVTSDFMKEDIARYFQWEEEALSDISVYLQMMAFCALDIEGKAVINYGGHIIKGHAQTIKDVLDIFEKNGFEWTDKEEQEEVTKLLDGTHEVFVADKEGEDE